MKQFNFLMFIFLVNSLFAQTEQNKIFFNACIKGDIEVIKKILENNFDIDLTDKQGITGLNFAVAYNQFNVVRFLIEKGANLNIKDKNGWSPIITASQLLKDKTEIVKYLIQNGANINQVDKDGFSALHIAIENNYFNVAKLLIIKGIDISIKTKLDKETALHKAVRSNNFELVQLLLDKGAKISEVNYENLSALQIAESESSNDIYEILKDYSNKKSLTLKKK